MLPPRLLVGVFILGLIALQGKAQEVDASLNLRIKPWEIGVYTGIFKDRIHNTPYKFSNSATLVEFALPLYWVLLPKEQHLAKEVTAPMLKIKPSIITMLLSTGSSALGFSSVFSLKIFNALYFNYNLGFVWGGAQLKKGKGDGIKHGKNFLHFFSLEYKLQENLYLISGATHISNGGILGEDKDTSNSDALLLGIRYCFSK